MQVTKILRYKMFYTTFINQCKTFLDNVRHCQFWTFCNFGHIVTLDIFYLQTFVT